MLEDNKIEDIKRNLYDPNDKMMSHHKEGVLHNITHDTTSSWKEDLLKKENDMNNKTKKSKTSLYKIFFIFSVIIFFVATGFAFYRFFYNDTSVSSEKIKIEIIGNAFTNGGDDLPLQIEITNNNRANLELTNLIIEYPKGAEDSSTSMVRLPKDSIGTIKPGEVIIRNVNIKLFGTEKSIRNINIALEYHPQGSNAIFTKNVIYPVTIDSAPLSLSVESPLNTTSNQPITLKINSVLNTAISGTNPILQLKYPNNFIFDSAIPAPILGNSVWDLSSISNTNPISIEIKGRLIGEDGDEQVFHAYAGETNGTDRSMVSVIYSSILQKILITKPFLSANILVNNEDKIEYAISPGEDVEVEIDWENNLSNRVIDGAITVNLSGNILNKDNVRSNTGFYDSENSQIIWDKNSVPQLGEINPGEKGKVSFVIKIDPSSGSRDIIKNPQLSIKVSIKGRQPQLGSTYSEVNNFTEKTIKVLSNFQIASSLSYYSGSITPKAESETVYKITWTLSNSTNKITQAEARAVIPPYVKWVGTVFGEKESIIYKDLNRELTWNIGQVLPNTGIDSNREVSFLVSIKPSVSQVDSVPQLVGGLSLSGMDSFANVLIKNSSSPVNTSSSGNNGRVIR